MPRISANEGTVSSVDRNVEKENGVLIFRLLLPTRINKRRREVLNRKSDFHTFVK